MNDVNEPHPRPLEPEEATGGPADRPGPPADPATAPADDGQVLLVRRRRTPALGLWVLLALAIPFLIGMVVAWSVEVRHLTGMLYFGVTAAVLIGFPLALIAAIVDAVVHRRRR